MRLYLAPLMPIALMAIIVAGCQPAAEEAGVDEAALRRHVFELAGDAYGGRNGGYEGERRAALYIAEEFRVLDLDPAGGVDSYLQEFEFLPRLPEHPGQKLTSQNVVAILRGRQTATDSDVVVVGAHYDGQGRAGQADPGRDDSELAEPGDEIWNAANDNAVSVAVILEIARLFRSGRFVNDRDLIFCLFGAEEHGIVGAFEYVNGPAVPLDETTMMLNLEQLGLMPGEELMTAGFATSSAWPQAVERADSRTGHSTMLALDLPAADTDHYPFFLRGIPAMTIGHPDGPTTHTAADETEDISYPDLAWRTELIATLVEELANLESPPSFAADIERELPFVATAVSHDELAAVGLPPDSRALKVAVVLAGSRADGELAAGDLITAIDGKILPEGIEFDLHHLARSRPEVGCLAFTVISDGEERQICF